MLFLVGRVIGMEEKDDELQRWVVTGIWDSKDKAIAHCTSWYDFFCGPLSLNEYLGDPREWDCHYPLAEDYYKKHPEEVPEGSRERFDKIMHDYQNVWDGILARKKVEGL